MPALPDTAVHLRPHPIRSGRPGIGSLLEWLASCAHRHRTRAALRELCPRRLRDLGLTKGQALREARKPFWRP